MADDDLLGPDDAEEGGMQAGDSLSEGEDADDTLGDAETVRGSEHHGLTPPD
jgi:hypothetical protein